MCVKIGLDLNIYEHLVKKHPCTVSEIAKVTDAEVLLLSRLLRSLAAIGYVREIKADTYAPSPISYLMLKPNVRAGYNHW